MKFDRFDFEQQIMTCWSVVEDLKAVAESSDYTKVSEDDYQNALLGMATLYQMKFEKLWSQFEASFKYYRKEQQEAYQRGLEQATEEQDSEEDDWLQIQEAVNEFNDDPPSETEAWHWTRGAM